MLLWTPCHSARSCWRLESSSTRRSIRALEGGSWDALQGSHMSLTAAVKGVTGTPTAHLQEITYERVRTAACTSCNAHGRPASWAAPLGIPPTQQECRHPARMLSSPQKLSQGAFQILPPGSKSLMGSPFYLQPLPQRWPRGSPSPGPQRLNAVPHQLPGGMAACTWESEPH